MLSVCEHMLDSVAWLPLNIVTLMENIYLETDNDPGLFSLSFIISNYFPFSNYGPFLKIKVSIML